MLVIAKIQKLFAAFFADRESVRAAFELPSPGANEFAFVVEDHHGVQAFAGGIHGVMNVDVALRILADAVGIAVFDGARQLAPIVNGFVLMISGAEDGGLRSCLVSRPQKDGSGGSDCGSGKKTTSCDLHGQVLSIRKSATPHASS